MDESWTVKKAECQMMEAFKLWCWRRDLRVPWTARRPNQSILKKINPKYSLEELILKLKLQFFGHLIWKAKSVHSKGNQSWILTGRTDAKAEDPILWPPDAKNWLIGKGPDAGKDWREEEKGVTENEMIGWHHQLDGHEFEQTPGVGDGQGSLTCCRSWGHKESDTTEQLSWTE